MRWRTEPRAAADARHARQPKALRGSRLVLNVVPTDVVSRSWWEQREILNVRRADAGHLWAAWPDRMPVESMLRVEAKARQAVEQGALPARWGARGPAILARARRTKRSPPHDATKRTDTPFSEQGIVATIAVM